MVASRRRMTSPKDQQARMAHYGGVVAMGALSIREIQTGICGPDRRPRYSTVQTMVSPRSQRGRTKGKDDGSRFKRRRAISAGCGAVSRHSRLVLFCRFLGTKRIAYQNKEAVYGIL